MDMADRFIDFGHYEFILTRTTAGCNDRPDGDRGQEVCVHPLPVDGTLELANFYIFATGTLRVN